MYSQKISPSQRIPTIRSFAPFAMTLCCLLALQTQMYFRDGVYLFLKGEIRIPLAQGVFTSISGKTIDIPLVCDFWWPGSLPVRFREFSMCNEKLKIISTFFATSVQNKHSRGKNPKRNTNLKTNQTKPKRKKHNRHRSRQDRYVILA